MLPARRPRAPLDQAASTVPFQAWDNFATHGDNFNVDDKSIHVHTPTHAIQFDVATIVTRKGLYMRSFIPAFIVLATLVACGGGEDEAGTKVFKSMGSLQCSGGGVSLAALQGQLVALNVQVNSAACGTDGVAHPATCGATDGKIGIFEVSSAQTAAAAAAGFAPLSTLPSAKTIPCA